MTSNDPSICATCSNMLGVLIADYSKSINQQCLCNGVNGFHWDDYLKKCLCSLTKYASKIDKIDICVSCSAIAYSDGNSNGLVCNSPPDMKLSK